MTEHEYRDGVSPSAIELFRTCNRKAALQKLFGAPKAAPSKGTLFGREVDRIVNVAVNTGERIINPQDPTPGETAREILALLPAVGANAQKSYRVKAPSLALDYDWLGRLDVYADRDIPLVVDVKTRGKEIHVLRASMFPDDPQCVQYAYAHDKGNGVDLEWISAITGTKREPIVERSRWSHDQVQEYAVKLSVESDELVTLLRSKPAKPDDVPYNVKGCDAFGGCPYRGNLCQLPLSAMVESIFGKEGSSDMSNLMDQLKQQQNGVQVPTTTAAGTVTPMDLTSFFAKPATPATPAEPVRGSFEYAKARATPLPAGSTAPNGLPLPAAVCTSGIVSSDGKFWSIADVLATEGEGPAKATELLNAAAGPAINPPESAGAQTPTEAQAAIAPVQIASIPGVTAPLEPLPVTPAVAETGTAPMEVGTSAEPVKRRGRPKGSKNTGTTPAAAPRTDGKTLYIGCYPVGQDYNSIEDMYADVHDAIQKEKGVADFGLLPFGEGAGCFRGFALAAFQAAEPGDYVVADASSRESGVALASLAAAADRVVRGMR